MASSRQDRPKRSAHASDETRDKRYRYKSYLDADTQEMARFDAMQEHVPDKIDEVMASFREEKLTVSPARRSVSEEISTANTPFFSTAKVTRPQKKNRLIWIWFAGLTVLIFGGVLWMSSMPEEPKARSKQVAVPEKTNPATPIAASSSAVVAPSPVTETPPAPLPKKEAVVVAQPKSTKPVAVQVTKAVEAKSADVPKKKPKKPAPVHKYSEDLSDILQNR